MKPIYIFKSLTDRDIGYSYNNNTPGKVQIDHRRWST